MRLRESPAVSLLFSLVLSVVIVGSLAACGGGQSGGGGQEKQQEDKPAGKPAGEVAKKDSLPRKVAFGTVRAYKDDKRRLSLRPTVNAKGDKPLGFKVRKNAKITFAGEKADTKAIKEDQQAQITYVVKNEVNRAVVVDLFEPEDRPSGGDEKKSEQPSDGGEKSG